MKLPECTPENAGSPARIFRRASVLPSQKNFVAIVAAGPDLGGADKVDEYMLVHQRRARHHRLSSSPLRAEVHDESRSFGPLYRFYRCRPISSAESPC